MEKTLTWQERVDLLTEEQRRGLVPNKFGKNMIDLGYLSPYTANMIHWFCDQYGIPRTIKSPDSN